MLGWVQKWRRHGWVNAKGPIRHRDLWESLLRLTEEYGAHVKWPHAPSHIETPGNTRADHLADVGRRQSPLLFGHISARPRRNEGPEEGESEEEWDAEWEGWEPREEPEAPDPPPPQGRVTTRCSAPHKGVHQGQKGAG